MKKATFCIFIFLMLISNCNKNNVSAQTSSGDKIAEDTNTDEQATMQTVLTENNITILTTDEFEKIKTQYKIGDKGPAGGIVFYDKGNYDDGWRYKEVAPKETEFKASDYDADPKRAIALCEKMFYGGYEDWYLPTIDDLELIYNNLHKTGIYKLGGNDLFEYYMSSSHHDGYLIEGWKDAWWVFAFDGKWQQGKINMDPLDAAKNTAVRFVRAF